MDLISSLLVAGAIMGLIDALWLGVVANNLYKDQLGPLLRKKPDMKAAVAFYIIYVVGIVIFAILPASDWLAAGGYGALFGFVAYATYDLTNMATIQGFPWKIVAIDLTWGTVLTASVAALTHLITGLWIQ